MLKAFAGRLINFVKAPLGAAERSLARCFDREISDLSLYIGIDMIDKENGVNSTEDGKNAVISEDSDAEKQEASEAKEAKRGRATPVSALICVALASAVITSQLTSLFMKAKYEKELSDAQGGEYFDQALLIDSYIRQFYIGEIDEQALRQALAMAYIYALGDNYAYYYTAEEYEAQIEKLDGNAFGIGVRGTADDSGGILVLQVMA